MDLTYRSSGNPPGTEIYYLHALVTPLHLPIVIYYQIDAKIATFFAGSHPQASLEAATRQIFEIATAIFNGLAMT